MRLDTGECDGINAHAIDSFHVAGLETIQFVSCSPDYLRIDYVGPKSIDGSIRREFKRLLKLKGALATGFDVRRVARVAIDPQSGKANLVRFANGTDECRRTG